MKYGLTVFPFFLFLLGVLVGAMTQDYLSYRTFTLQDASRINAACIGIKGNAKVDNMRISKNDLYVQCADGEIRGPYPR